MLHAQALSRSYTEQLQRTVSGLNQITLTLKYYWENSGIRFSPEDQASHGLYPPSSRLYVVVFDRWGRNLSSTMPDPSPQSVADREYFKAHLGRAETGLFVSQPYISLAFGRTVIAFSRALHRTDGALVAAKTGETAQAGGALLASAPRLEGKSGVRSANAAEFSVALRWPRSCGSSAMP
jgi:hypothetical protein